MALRVGMIGMGGLGTLHCKSILGMKDAQVAALCDVRPERMTGDFAGTAINIERGDSEGSADLSAARKFTDYREMLREKLDAVVIATPTFLHAQLAIDALQSGKHVFCEKPMALNAADARRMAAAARDSKRFLQIGHCLRFFPEYEIAKQMIDDGRYGRVVSGFFKRGGGYPGWSWENWYLRPEMSGGAVLDLHIHDVDIVHWLLGKPDGVFADGVTDPSGSINHVTTSYIYNSPHKMVTAQALWVPGDLPFDMMFMIQFEKATIDYYLSRKPTMLLYEPDKKPVAVEVPAGDSYRIEIEQFLSCVRKGQAPSRITPEESAHAVAVVEAEVESIRTRKIVPVA